MDHAGIELARDMMRAPQILRMDIAAKTIGGAVGERDRLLLAVERRDRQHRPEHLVLGDAGAVVDVGNDGDRQEEAVRPLAAEPLAACDQPAAVLLHRGIDDAEDARQRGLGDDRA